jgi:leucyl aminopeptidase (aminopeptidase T)
MFYWKYELIKASDILVRELFDVKQNEIFVITADTESDPNVVDATAGAVYSAGGKPMVVWLATPPGVSMAADPGLPLKSLTDTLLNADCWVEFNRKWLLYSTPSNIAFKKNPNLRYMNLTGINVRSMVNCIGRVNYPLLNGLVEMIHYRVRKTKHFRMTAPNGHDVSFDNVPDRPVVRENGYARTGGVHMIAGQLAWTPALETISGNIVLDGSISPDVGVLKSPVKMQVEKGVILNITGGHEAVTFDVWTKTFNDPQMRRIAHAGFGFLPNATLCGNILEDQRVWGSTTWGVGSISAGLLPPNGVPGSSHSDSVCLNTSVYFDDELVLDKGQFIPEDLRKLQKALGR